MAEYIILNGELFPEESPVLYSKNRAFRYADLLFETLRSNGTQIQLFDQHMGRLIRGMKTLDMIVPENFSENIKLNIIYLINKNKSFSGTRIRLSIFRNGEGLYAPNDCNVSYLIETSLLENEQYELNKKGLSIGIYNKCLKPIDLLSPFKTGNSLLFVMAGNYQRKMKWDDCLILNERGNIIESTGSNLFVVKDNTLMSPGVESGAVGGIMREQLMKIALEAGITVYDDCAITTKDLLKADEVFLSNAVCGIKWVVAYCERRYFNKMSKYLIAALNENLKSR